MPRVVSLTNHNCIFDQQGSLNTTLYSLSVEQTGDNLWWLVTGSQGLTSGNTADQVDNPTNIGKSHITNSGNSHITSIGNSHITNIGNSHKTNIGNSLITNIGNSHITNSGKSHITHIRNSHITNIGNSHITIIWNSHITNADKVHKYAINIIKRAVA